MFVGNKEILKGIDFSLHNKEFLGIIGPAVAKVLS